ncbi:putative ankyrin repeat protein L63 [Zancudomyces culisetae]|nr:putative ankyrin repeat protein L63 [Zancudomyces culisetae]|eukprot:OMH80879.1 putative ankyrin repeat protein L63 [Zancudomyces culisetae]
MLKRLVTNIKGLFTCDEFDKTEEAILRKGNLELAKEFFENSGNLDIDYNRGMHMAYKNGDLEIIRMIILRDFGVYIKDPVLITVICHSNNTCLLKYMFRKHQYIGAKKNHGIMEAYYNKNVEMMKLLISSGVNVDIYDCLALKLAFKLNDIDFAKFLLAFNPDYPNNFLRKLKKIVIGNSRKKPDVNNKRYSIARCILSS